MRTFYLLYVHPELELTFMYVCVDTCLDICVHVCTWIHNMVTVLWCVYVRVYM